MFYRENRGQALVEMAGSLLVLMVIMMGIIEYSWMFKNRFTLENAAREGARAAALGQENAKIISRITNKVGTLMPAPVNLFLTNGSAAFTSRATIKVEYSTNNGVTWTNAPSTTNISTNVFSTNTYPNNVSTNNNIPSGALIRVTAQAQNTTITGFFPYMNNKWFSVTNMMRREL